MALRNFSDEAGDKAAFLIENRCLVFGRRDINSRVFGEEIGWLEVNLMGFDWHNRKVYLELVKNKELC